MYIEHLSYCQANIENTPLSLYLCARLWYSLLSRLIVDSLFYNKRLTLLLSSTGGIIALGLGVEGWSIDECIDQFAKLCTTAFTPREFHGIWGVEEISAISHKYSKYKTRPLDDILKTTFSVADQPLFGGNQNDCHASVKVAVTSTTETAENALLLTNYNRSHKTDNQGN